MKRKVLTGMFILLIIAGFAIFTKGRFLSLKAILTSVQTPSPTATSLPVTGMTQQDYVDKAIFDLSQKLGIDKEEIKVEEKENRNFNDTSLGCPQQNKVYAQVIIAGYEIILTAQSRSYTYHAGLNTVVSCR